jgi:hypothetical protein
MKVRTKTKSNRSRAKTRRAKKVRSERPRPPAGTPYLSIESLIAETNGNGAVNRQRRVFLLSPANAAGRRASYVTRETAEFELARKLREDGASLGELFSFISGLYFRGKLAYARAFANPPQEVPGVYVITACGGLMEPHTVMTRATLLSISAGKVHHDHPSYREPLERDARALAAKIGPECEVVLLGSVATPKYIEPLMGIWGDRLVFPAEFAGRGDMSRGGLMLRCVRDGLQLKYVPVATAQLHGPKPPRLPKLN